MSKKNIVDKKKIDNNTKSASPSRIRTVTEDYEYKGSSMRSIIARGKGPRNASRRKISRTPTEGKVMAESKKKSPDSSVEFQNAAIGDPSDYTPTYYHKDAMPKCSPSYSVYHDKSEAAKSGVTTQKEVGGQSYPGRALPAAQKVEDAKEEKGTTIRCAQKQNGINRYPN